MARKTKAEREAELQLQLEQQIAKDREAYPRLLMDSLERATNLGFKVEVKNCIFVVTQRNTNGRWDLAYDYTKESDIELSYLRNTLFIEEEEKAEADRKILVKQAALAKLTEEERVLLGLQTTSRY